GVVAPHAALDPCQRRVGVAEGALSVGVVEGWHGAVRDATPHLVHEIGRVVLPSSGDIHPRGRTPYTWRPPRDTQGAPGLDDGAVFLSAEDLGLHERRMEPGKCRVEPKAVPRGRRRLAVAMRIDERGAQ